MTKGFLVILIITGTVEQHAQTAPGPRHFSSVIDPVASVPFLLIAPDSRQSGIGNTGAATEPDVNAVHWNAAKLAFSEKDFGLGFTLTPWKRIYMPDINMYYVAGYGRISDRQCLGASLRYFSYGTIDFIDSLGMSSGSFRPNEFAIDIAFSQKLSNRFSVGIATRYINSSMSRVLFNGKTLFMGDSYSIDIAGYYRPNTFTILGKESSITAGFAFTNLGAKLNYAYSQSFLPMNMRLGAGLKSEINEYHTFGLYADVSKLLVPSPPIYKYKRNASGDVTTEIETDPATGKHVIERGTDPNVPVPVAIVQSFYDAPDGITGELREYGAGAGTEYCYKRFFAVRSGYSVGSVTSGGPQFFTFGMGIRLKVITIDGSCIIPSLMQSPVQGSVRFSIGFYFDAETKKNGSSGDTDL